MDKMITIRFDVDLLDKVDDAARLRNISRSAFVKLAISDYLQSMSILEREWPKMQAELADLQRKMADIPLPFDAFCANVLEDQARSDAPDQE